MSVLSEIDTASIAKAATADTNAAALDVPPFVVNAVRSEINSLFWKWYHEHEDNTVTHVHFWFFSRDIKVRDLHQAFTLLFGGEGEDMSIERPPATVAPEAPTQ